MTVEIPDDVEEQLDAIRRTGATNMFSRRNVRELAEEMEFDELLDWLDETDDETYAKLIMEGPA